MHNLFRSWTKKLSSPAPSPYPLLSSTGRISLQPLQSGEVRLVEEWFKDRETCELAFGVKAPWDVLCSMRSEYLEELQKDKVGVLSIRVGTSGASGPPVGFVRFKLFHRGRKKSARVGIILGPPTVRGLGIGREAFQTLLRYLFERKAVQVIDLDTAVFNSTAQSCFSACGFHPIREVEFTTIGSNWTEKRLMMRLTRSQWDAIFPR